MIIQHLRDIHGCAEVFLPRDFRLSLQRIRQLPDGAGYSLKFSTDVDPFLADEQVVQIVALEGTVTNIETSLRNDCIEITGHAIRRRQMLSAAITWSPFEDQRYFSALKNTPVPVRRAFHLIELSGEEGVDELTAFIEKLVLVTGAGIEVGFRVQIDILENGSNILNFVRKLRRRFGDELNIRTLLVDGVFNTAHWQIVERFASEGDFEFDLSILASPKMDKRWQAVRALTWRFGYRSIEIDPRCPSNGPDTRGLVRIPRTPYSFQMLDKLRRVVTGVVACIIITRVHIVDRLMLKLCKKWEAFIKRRNPVYVPFLRLFDPRPDTQKRFFNGVRENASLENTLPIDWPYIALVARIGRVLDTELQDYYRSSVNQCPSLSKFWQTYVVHNWASPGRAQGLLLDVGANSLRGLTKFMTSLEKTDWFRPVDADCYLREVQDTLSTENLSDLRSLQLDSHAYQFNGERAELSADGLAFIDWIDGKLGKVLEIGAGFGLTVEQLKSRSSLYVALDLTLAQTRSCQSKGAISIVSDMHDLPIADGVFDTVVADNTLEHSYDPKKLLLEIRRVLRVGGRLFALLPPDGMSRWYAMPAHYWKLDELSLTHGASIAGFKVERLEYLRYEDIGMYGGYNASGGSTILVEMVAL